MATETTNLGLTKPDAAEGYDIAVFNNNAELIDNAVGALQNELGGTGGGLGEKVDALQESMTAARSEIAAVKTDTTAARSEIASVKTDTAAILAQLNALRGDVSYANTNIVTLLSQSQAVKRIHSETVTFPENSYITTRTIPSDMNPDKVVIICSDVYATDSSLIWFKNGSTITFHGATNRQFSYQLVEFN